MASWLRQFTAGLTDLLFPPLCVVCRAPAPEHLCAACLSAMRPLEPPICHRCGRSLDLMAVSPARTFAGSLTCARCQAMESAFHCCRAYGPFQDPLRLAIHALKYGGKTAVVPVLAGLLAEAFQREPAFRSVQCILPVPLHRGRLRQRGFNQSELLAEALAARLGLDARCDLLARIRPTRAQVGLSAGQRRENLRDAFVVRAESLPAGALLLLDDVVTTGSTFHECARALRAAGAGTVYALALAHD